MLKLYPENYQVAVTFPFTDLNGDQVEPSAVTATLYDGEDKEVVDFGSLPFDAAEGYKEVTIPAAFNVLGTGQMQAARVLRVALTTPAGVIRRSFAYLIEGEFRLAIMVNSFQSIESAEILARDVLNLNGWHSASDEQRFTAMIEAFTRLIRIPMRFKHEDSIKLGDRTDMFAEETVIARSAWPKVTEEEFLSWPAHFRKALRMAQLVEANEQLEGDPIAKKHRAGIISETVGESSVMLRGGRVDHGISNNTLTYLTGYIYYNNRIARA